MVAGIVLKVKVTPNISRRLSDTSTVPNLMSGRADAVVEQEKEKVELKKQILETKFEKFTETHLLKAQAAAAFFYFN